MYLLSVSGVIDGKNNLVPDCKTCRGVVSNNRLLGYNDFSDKGFGTFASWCTHYLFPVNLDVYPGRGTCK